MVEQRPLSDAELDAALSEAFAVDPSPEFVARVRRRVAEDSSGGRHVPLFAVAAVISAAIVFVAVMFERTPVDERRPTRVAAAVNRTRATPPDAPVVGAAPRRPVAVRTDRDTARRLRATRVERRTNPETPDVLIPAVEQHALRRLLERPPTGVLQFSADRGDAVVVSEITVPRLNIDPLWHDTEEGGHQ
jgi:hypothetical protein